MRVRFLRDWSRFRVGAVADLGGGVAEALLHRKIIELCLPEFGVETAMLVAPEQRRGPGRPRKYPLV